MNMIEHTDKEDDWEDLETYHKNKRNICIEVDIEYRQIEKLYRSKCTWRRENYFNDKAGGTYKKINRLKTRREVQQYLYFQNRTSNQFSQKMFLNQEQRRQPLALCTLDH